MSMVCVDDILELNEKGMSNRDISVALNVPREVVKKKLLSNGRTSPYKKPPRESHISIVPTKEHQWSKGQIYREWISNIDISGLPMRAKIQEKYKYHVSCMVEAFIGGSWVGLYRESFKVR